MSHPPDEMTPGQWCERLAQAIRKRIDTGVDWEVYCDAEAAQEAAHYCVAAGFSDLVEELQKGEWAMSDKRFGWTGVPPHLPCGGPYIRREKADQHPTTHTPDDADLRNHAPTLARAVLDLTARVVELEVERDAALTEAAELRRAVEHVRAWCDESWLDTDISATVIQNIESILPPKQETTDER